MIRALFALLVLAAPAAADAAVGFERLTIPGPPGVAGTEIAVWYPTAAPASPQRLGLYVQEVAPGGPVAGSHLPLVVISHGSGGDLAGHHDTAEALAEAGLVAAALTQPGDNVRDHSQATDLPGRVRALEVLTDYMTTQWRPGAVDPRRVGAFGFSAGGFTVLAAAGARADLRRVGAHCSAHPDFYDCALMRAAGSSGDAAPSRAAPDRPTGDARLRALVVAAPALGFAFGREGLSDVRVPVQLWRGEADEVLPHPFYAEAVRRDLPRPPELHEVAGAGHYAFLAPCTAALAQVAPTICTDPPGFDRVRFHREFDRAVAAFFEAHL